jgi:hypothetical protein
LKAKLLNCSFFCSGRTGTWLWLTTSKFPTWPAKSHNCPASRLAFASCTGSQSADLSGRPKMGLSSLFEV